MEVSTDFEWLGPGIADISSGLDAGVLFSRGTSMRIGEIALDESHISI